MAHDLRVPVLDHFEVVVHFVVHPEALRDGAVIHGHLDGGGEAVPFAVQPAAVVRAASAERAVLRNAVALRLALVHLAAVLEHRLGSGSAVAPLAEASTSCS